jgi:flagellar biosynthesis GTPase FlhF
MTDDRPAPHRQPDEADQPLDPRTPDDHDRPVAAVAAFDDGPADRGSDAAHAAPAHADTASFDQTAFAAGAADGDHDARPAEARESHDAEARIAEAREREAREAEAREREAREAEAREREAREAEAREAEARQRDVEDRERRERESREVDARERAEREERDRRGRDDEAARQSSSQPIYVQAPVPPQKRGNRGFGVLIAVVAAILFALLYSLGTALLASVRNPDAFGDVFGRYLSSPVFYVPTIAFLILFVLLALLVNRGKWWAFVLGGLPVAILVYAAYVGTRLLQGGVLDIAPSEQALLLQRTVTFPDGILAGFLARELVTWLGAAISARGRHVRAKNAEARAEYDRKLQEQPDHR